MVDGDVPGNRNHRFANEGIMDNEIMDDIGSDYALCALLKSWRSWFLTRNEILAIQQGQSAMRYRRGTRKTSAAQ